MKTYTKTLLLLLGIAIGAVCGIIFGPAASVVKPVGEMFLNMMFVLVVPLVFFSIASSVSRMTAEKKVWKVLGLSILVFLATSVIAGMLTWFLCGFWNPLGAFATKIPPERSGVAGIALAGKTFLETMSNMFTVNDFQKLLSKENLLPLVVFSAFLGTAAALSGEKGKPVVKFLDSGMVVVMEFMKVLMYVAPICLGCYFADMIGKLGGGIIGGYLNSLLIFLVMTAVIYFVVNSIYVFLAGGKQLLLDYWKNIPGPSLMAISTCSSAATIPSAIEAAKKMGADESIAESVIPLGINTHKDGSVISGVLMILFTASFYGLSGFGCLEVVGISILTSLVVGAVPVGGMTREILICTILGIDPGFSATLLVICTLIDIPATLLNATDNIVSALWVDKLCNRSV